MGLELQKIIIAKAIVQQGGDLGTADLLSVGSHNYSNEVQIIPGGSGRQGVSGQAGVAGF